MFTEVLIRNYYVQGEADELVHGWDDIDLSHSTVCLVLLGQMGIWQNRLGRGAKWWNI